MRATGPSGTNRLAGKTFSERARPGNLFGCPGNRFDHLVIVQVLEHAKALALPRRGLGPATGGTGNFSFAESKISPKKFALDPALPLR